MSPNQRGAALMVATMAAFTFNDAAIKVVGVDLSVYQMMFLRGVMVSVVFAVWLGVRGLGLSRVSRRDGWLMLLRGACEFAAAAVFLSALVVAEIGTLTAILQSTPLAVTLAGAIVLGERVGWRRWGAICAGFVGVMLIMQPSRDGIEAPALLALISVGFITLRDITTRYLSPDVPSKLAALVTAICVTIPAGLMTMTGDWVPVTATHAGLLVLAAALMVVGYLCSVATMRVGEISFVSPFRYSAILWALLLGVTLFGERPGFWQLAGAGIVVAAGIFTLRRNHAARRG
ncbi:hypothetical protein ACMU_04685 [Actibacterium mucosum KCTC 23349]|uniref:EamA domain-containing protein n=1 Tax=Actibacterium mucosum KCTC 23349 TaxID=1454373 RepID=A0A037ZEG9_9RHOB|nr:DMT family transporter [Actibacterium mucosum]KAJ54003.1 hypothetical protein ACMU_04685 [Actibacterium mucosum KCTC 23349]